MIEKSRLEELIKEGATIYTISKEIFIVGVSDLVKVTPYKLNKACYIAETDGEESLMIRLFDENSNIQPALIGYLQNLFETEKQAEWALKYQLIPRTEWLNLPMWEELIDKKKNGRIYINEFVCGNEYDLLVVCSLGVDFEGKIEIRNVSLNHKLLFQAPLSEENYIKACDLCVKLFKGEDKSIETIIDQIEKGEEK